MPAKNVDLHGRRTDKSVVALLLIDVINDFDFPEAAELVRHALPMAERIAVLKQRAKESGIPVVYVNDNFGRWRSDFAAQVTHCLSDNNPGKAVVNDDRIPAGEARCHVGIDLIDEDDGVAHDHAGERDKA